MKIQESAENYLEAILELKEKHGSVRSIDVVQHLGVSKPSVSRAMSLLRENGYVEMDKDGLLSLTEQGAAIAERIYDRHKILTRWLISLGVDSADAAADACKMEHAMSESTFLKMKEHILREI